MRRKLARVSVEEPRVPAVRNFPFKADEVSGKGQKERNGEGAGKISMQIRGQSSRSRIHLQPLRLHRCLSNRSKLTDATVRVPSVFHRRWSSTSKVPALRIVTSDPVIRMRNRGNPLVKFKYPNGIEPSSDILLVVFWPRGGRGAESNGWDD